MRLTIYENLKRIVSHLTETFNFIPSPARTGRPRKITPRDALTLALYQHASVRATKRSLYEDFKTALRCSYKTLVVAVNHAGVLALRILGILMRLNQKSAHPVKYTDATDLPVCLKKNADTHWVMQDLSGFGYSTKGWYFGLKMTLTRDHDGQMLAVRFSHPNLSDRDLFQSINRDIYGILVADAGYLSKAMERAMYVEGKRWVLTRPLKSMKKLAAAWQLKLYHGRFRIELDFRSLKLFFGLVTSLPRSVNGYLSNYLHALLAFALR